MEGRDIRALLRDENSETRVRRHIDALERCTTLLSLYLARVIFFKIAPISGSLRGLPMPAPASGFILYSR